jgi:hypothetical protein
VGFKEAISKYGKEITASFVYNDVIYKEEQIISMNPHFEGSLLKTVMKCLDIELDGELLEDTCAIVGLAIAGKAVTGIGEVTKDNTIRTPKFGVKAPGDADYSYIEYGSYLIKESKKDEETHGISLECYDFMLQSMIPYDLSLDYSVGITVKDYLDAICDRLGWEKGYTTFYNCDVLIDGEKYDISDTFRDALDDIAEVVGGMIGFVGDKLAIIYPTDSGEVIDEENLKSLKIGKKFGPINSVVLARTPQEDNIYFQDVESVTAHGLCEIRIENNQIIDTHREDFMEGICNALFGLSFELYDLESFGIGYLNLGDFFALKTADGTEHKVLMLCDDLQITQGLTETSKLEEPTIKATDYSAASETDKTLKQTILRVDKQANEISALVSSTKTIEDNLTGLSKEVTDMSELVMTPKEVEIKISEVVGGIDSVKTSTGYTFDKDGLNIHKDGEEMHNTLDNNGMYVRRGSENVLVADKDGVNAINLTARQYLIVGDNARFEDYNNGTDYHRTACFFIGG